MLVLTALQARHARQIISKPTSVAYFSTKLSYSERQAATGRPVSPHVTIYSFPITALSSITNRVTGAALSVGTMGVGGLALVGVDVGSLMTAIGSSAIGPLAKFSVGFPLVYHYLGGIRHVIWDRKPDLLTNEQVPQSSYILFGSAGIIGIGCALL